jgi:hypothetical protein
MNLRDVGKPTRPTSTILLRPTTSGRGPVPLGAPRLARCNDCGLAGGHGRRRRDVAGEDVAGRAMIGSNGLGRPQDIADVR